MAHQFEFVGVGGLAYDLLLQVQRLPLSDEKYPAQLIGKVPGGFIANATCAAARLGLKTGYIGWVGDDAEGDMLRADFEDYRVDVTGLASVPGQTTPFTVVITDRTGKRSIVLPSFPLYDANLDVDQLAVAASARVVYTLPRDLTWCARLRQVTLDSGGLFALDVENAVTMRGDELRDVARLADVLFLTASSIRLLGAKSVKQVAAGRQWVIMTAGSKGAYGIQAGMRRPAYQSARKVQVVDSTGAGDSFHAALIAAKLDGADVQEALRFAAAAASITVQHRGARGGLPTRAEVERLLM